MNYHRTTFVQIVIRCFSFLGMLISLLVKPTPAFAQQGEIPICEIIWCGDGPYPPPICQPGVPCGLPLPPWLSKQLEIGTIATDRGNPLIAEFSHLSSNSNVTYLLYRLDPSTQLLQPMSQVSADPLKPLKENLADFGMVPNTAPSGQYVVIGCTQADCSFDNVNKQLEQLDSGVQGLDSYQFAIPRRIDKLVLDVDQTGGVGKTLKLDATWEDPLASPADDVRVIWYKDNQVLSAYESGRLTNAAPMFDFLDNNRQSTSLFKPTLANRVVPGVTRFFPKLDYPSLDNGTYRVEVYLNGALERSESVTVTESPN